ncbi:hypothetical protein H9Q69_006446 [Fusarium xylarioides]|nr:hypothetical protein H9Q69_006446 [Fusarium xylarioides]
MRSLAIKSLPPHYEDTNDLNSINVEQRSWGSSLPQSRSTIKNASTVNLDFIDTRGLGQLSEDPSIPNIMEIEAVPGPGFEQPLPTMITDASQSFTMYGNPIPEKPVTQQSLVKPQVQQFACPFYKHDPERYETSRAYSGPGWQTVHRVKEHIFRKHTMPEHECERCFEVFKTELNLSRHLRKAALCEVASHRPQENEGINAAQSQQLRARARKAEPGSDIRMVEEER